MGPNPCASFSIEHLLELTGLLLNAGFCAQGLDDAVLAVPGLAGGDFGPKIAPVGVGMKIESGVQRQVFEDLTSPFSVARQQENYRRIGFEQEGPPSDEVPSELNLL